MLVSSKRKGTGGEGKVLGKVKVLGQSLSNCPADLSPFPKKPDNDTDSEEIIEFRLFSTAQR